MSTFTHFSDIAKEAPPPAHGILSRTLFNDDHVKVVIFGFAEGEELSEHTSSMPAVMHFLDGQATVGLGDESLEAQPGTWIQMQPQTRHSIKAKTPVVMLLQMFKTPGT